MFSFSAAGLRPGDTLISTLDDKITATVEDHRKIKFRGEITSLNKATLKILHEKGRTWTVVQGPLYWKLSDGTKLIDRQKLEKQAEPIQTAPLTDALRSVVEKDQRATDETRAFLEDENHLRSFAEQIQLGSERAAFLEISGINGDIYENLRTILNGHTLEGQTKIVVKRGRTGGMTLVSTSGEAQQPTIDQAEVSKVLKETEDINSEELRLERQYYPLVRTWAEENGYANCEIVGGRLPGFRWENPDLVAIDYVMNKFTRSVAFDITSFEVKLRVEPNAIWQAAHYKRFSRDVYIAFAKDEKTIRDQDDGRVFDLAIELGLGVLAFGDRKFKAIQSPKSEVPQETKVNEILMNYSNIEGMEELIEKASEELDGHFDRWMKGHFKF